MTTLSLSWEGEGGGTFCEPTTKLNSPTPPPTTDSGG
jgi:hypothetical protein